jgi:acetyl esterase/lipase
VAFNEIYSSTRHLIDNADLFKIDKKRVAIAGDSTGGIMAAALVHKLRKENVDLKLSCLINPPLQFADLTLPSYQQNEKANHLNILSYEGVSRILHEYLGLLIPPTSMQNNSHVSGKMKQIFSAKNLLPRNLLPEKYISVYSEINVSNEKTAIPDDSLIFDENISPLLASDDTLKLCPQTYIVTSEYDIFRDDGYLYEARLKNLGVNVNLKNYEHGYHGPLNLYQNQECKLPKTLFEDLVKYIIDNL